MLRASLQLWQSLGCASIVIVRQGQKERSGTKKNKANKRLDLTSFFFELCCACHYNCVWQSLGCASIVIVRQRGQKERSGTKKNKANKRLDLTSFFFELCCARHYNCVWQSLGCASIVIVRQRGQKERLGTKKKDLIWHHGSKWIGIAEKPKQTKPTTPKKEDLQ